MRWRTKLWTHWKVGGRLAFIGFFCLANVALVGVMGLRAVGEQAAAMSSLGAISEAQRFHQNADMMHDGIRANVYAATLAGEFNSISTDEVLSELALNAQVMRDDIHAISKLELSPELLALVTGEMPQLETYLAEAASVAALMRRDRVAAVAQFPKVDAAFNALRVSMGQTTAKLSEAVRAADLAAKNAATQAKQNILVTTLIIWIIDLCAFWLIGESIRRSVRVVRDAASKMAEGDLTAHSDIATADELGELSQSLNRMADNLKNMLDHMQADATRDAFVAHLGDALEIATTEGEAHVVVARAMEVISPDHPMELLLADSSRAKLERAAAHAHAGAPGCEVESPFGCIAVRRGNTARFEHSEALNACPQLRGRSCGPVSAVCVPVSFMGRSLGVLHTTGPAGELLKTEQIAQLRTLAMQAGSRIGTVRAFERTQVQASTDSLTGLPNRRSLDETVQTLTTAATPYTLVMADLDHFKRLNDSLGHEAGDAALKVFAEVLRRTVREHDHPARWGGEEFAIILPGATAAVAAKVMDRLRAELAETLLTTGTAVFTASFGVADTTMHKSYDQLVRIADDALYRSKENGRDCVTIGDPTMVPRATPRRKPDQLAAIDLHKVAAEG